MLSKSPQHKFQHSRAHICLKIKYLQLIYDKVMYICCEKILISNFEEKKTFYCLTVTCLQNCTTFFLSFYDTFNIESLSEYWMFELYTLDGLLFE